MKIPITYVPSTHYPSKIIKLSFGAFGISTYVEFKNTCIVCNKVVREGRWCTFHDDLQSTYEKG